MNHPIKGCCEVDSERMSITNVLFPGLPLQKASGPSSSAVSKVYILFLPIHPSGVFVKKFAIVLTKSSRSIAETYAPAYIL